MCVCIGLCVRVFGAKQTNNNISSLPPHSLPHPVPPAHQGKNCSEPFNVCEPNPCVAGTCNATHDGHFYKCFCPPGRRGQKCELFDYPCDSYECMNDGTCVPDFLPNADGSYNSSGALCICCSGFSGDRCETASENHTLCRPNPCQNGGECQLLVEMGYRCECAVGYTGVNCELSDLCIEGRSSCNPQNTDACYVVSDDDEVAEEREICICKDGWGGDTCSEDLDECLDPSVASCQNGGSCVNTPGWFYCSCVPQYTGSKCEVYVPQPVNCSSYQRCLNGGTCVDKEPGTMVCECPERYTGDLCEILGECGPYITLSTPHSTWYTPAMLCHIQYDTMFVCM